MKRFSHSHSPDTGACAASSIFWPRGLSRDSCHIHFSIWFVYVESAQRFNSSWSIRTISTHNKLNRFWNHTHMSNYRRREYEYLFIVSEAHSLTSIAFIQCRPLHTSDTIVPYCSIYEWRMEQQERTTTTRPAHEWYLCKYIIINLFSRTQYLKRCVGTMQTEKPTKKWNLVDFISIEIVFRIHLLATHEARLTSSCNDTGRCLISTFILFISNLFFRYYHLRCCWMFDAFFIASSFCVLLFVVIQSMLVYVRRASQAVIIGKVLKKKCNWFDQLFNLANCVALSLSRNETYFFRLLNSEYFCRWHCGRSNRINFCGQSQYTK